MFSNEEDIDIQKIINLSSDFSFVDRLGSFINNREFQESYINFKNGEDSSNTFIWSALSSIGNEIGNKIYTNIRDYIDLVSNIDRCKCNNLHSMFKMYGETYSILGNYENYPIEVKNLIDIFSINKKYLLKNNFLSEDFKNHLISEEVISGELSVYDSDNNILIDNTILDEEKYENYITNVFETLLISFLDLTYNNIEQTPIRKTLTQEDLLNYNLSSYQQTNTSDIEQFKKIYNIPRSFNEQQIVDDIDQGKDFLDNYVGYQKELLEMEIIKRASTLNSDDIQYHTDSNNNSIELKTRYSYYRKSKVLEYYNFLNKFFSDGSSLSSVKYYDFNQQYFEVENTDIKSLTESEDNGYEINYDLVKKTAEQLKDITLYICKLRDRLKIQTRKNYMSGTSNLLRYLINQYLVDYSKTSPLFKNIDNPLLSSLKTIMSNHSVNDVDVIEYIDQTEYFNIQTPVDNKAVNGKETNERYWEGENKQRSGCITDEEINKFYLRDLGLSCDSRISNLTDFLDIIYNLGADSSYIDNTGNFVSKLSADVYSDEIHIQLSSLRYSWDEILKYIQNNQEQYSFPSVEISNQISNVVDTCILPMISAKYLNGVYDIYDKYIDDINNISSQIESLRTDVNNIIYGDYNYYFAKSESEYCYNNDIYKYDYLIDNPKYNLDNIEQTINIISSYCENNSFEYNGLKSTVEFLKNNYNIIEYKYIDTIGNIEKMGFKDVAQRTIDKRIQEAIDFIDMYINIEATTKEKTENELRLQITNIKDIYDSVEKFTYNVLSNILSGNIQDRLIFKPKGLTKIKSKNNDANDLTSLTCNFSQLGNILGKNNAENYYIPILLFSAPTYMLDNNKNETIPKITEVISNKIYDWLVKQTNNVIDVEISEKYYDKEDYYYTFPSWTYKFYRTKLDNYDMSKDDKDNILLESHRQKSLREYNYVIYNTNSQFKKFNSCNTYWDSEDGRTIILVRPKRDEDFFIKVDKDDNGNEKIVSSIEDILRVLINRLLFPQYLGNIAYKGVNTTAEIASLQCSDSDKGDASCILGKGKTLTDLLAQLLANYIKIKQITKQKLEDFKKDADAKYLKDTLPDEGGNTIADSWKNLTSEENMEKLSLSQKIAKFYNFVDDKEDISQIYTLYGYKGQYTSIYNEYTKILDVYNQIAKITEYQKYLENSTYDSVYFEQIQLESLMDYIQKTDIINKNDILLKLQECKHRYDNICNEILLLEEKIKQEYKNYETIIDHIENKPQYIQFMLSNFVNYNIGVAQEQIRKEYDILNNNIGVVKTYISDDLDSYDILSDIVEAKLIGINYVQYPQYQAALSNFNMYNGITQNADVYYNYKNITHPSRQYHPYLWNMIDQSKCIDEYVNIFNDYKIEQLNEENIQRNIDNYIGIFGQSINIWKNNAQDYTGYSSRYEKSTHQINNKFSKVVDYDGAFYPEAIDFLRKYGIDYCISALQAENDPSIYESLDIEKIKILSTFFDEYYGPLNLSESDINDEIEKLSTYGNDISIITNNVSSINEVYDIYKYGVDIYNNTYTLYKQYKKSETEFYDVDELTYNIKKNTPGTIWVRKAGRPFAYPAFHKDDNGKQNGNIVITDEYTSLSNSIYSDSGVVYDFEFTNFKNKMVLIVENKTTDGIKSFETANTYVSEIYNEIDYKNDNKSILKIKDLNVQNNFERLEKILQDGDIYSGNVSVKSNNVDSGVYTLVGVHVINENINGVYATKTLSGDNLILERETTIKVVNYSDKKISKCDLVFPSQPHTNDIVSQMYDNHIACAVVVESPLKNCNIINTYSTDTNVSSSNNYGYIQSAPNESEMNSHDVFTSDILLYKFSPSFGMRNNPGTLKILQINRFNTNADMSYIPVYPGLNHKFDITQTDLSNNVYHAIELLGNSRNMDDLINRVNPTPDPYFTIDDIKENHVFGRVYEDFDFMKDKTCKILLNPSINNNTPDDLGIIYDETFGKFTWVIKLDEVFNTENDDNKYNSEDYNKLKLIMFNRGTIGKNPYYIKNLITLTSETNAFYNDDQIGNYEVELEENILHVTGTYNNRQVNSIESNRLNNISCITIQYNTDDKQISANFYITEYSDSDSDSDSVDFKHIDKGTIALCLLNINDLTKFTYYHYLDAYGIYISADNSNKTEHVPLISEDSYKIEYGDLQNSEGDDNFSDGSTGRFWNYYVDKYGSKQYLREFDSNKFKNYDYLSSIEILQGYKKLAFKYDEELYFDPKTPDYVYPSLNFKYPRTHGMYVNDEGMNMKVFDDINIVNMYNDDEVFVMHINNTNEILSSIGNVVIDVEYSNEDVIIVDEDMFKNDISKYSIDDARAVEYIIVDESIEHSDINDDDLSKNLLSVLIDEQNLSGIMSDNNIDTDYKVIDMSSYGDKFSEIQDMFNIYVTYKKDVENQNKITLYFNYNNYINTPFIKIEDSKVYSNIIEGTYLKLEAGENDSLDIVIQLRYVEHGNIIGYKNIKVLSYQIYNISDDKPKFVISEIYRYNNNTSLTKQTYKFDIFANDYEINDTDASYTQRIYWDVAIPPDNIKFDLVYDYTILKYNSSTIDPKYDGVDIVSFDISNPSTGYIDVTFDIKQTNINKSIQTDITIEYVDVKSSEEMIVNRVKNGILTITHET